MWKRIVLFLALAALCTGAGAAPLKLYVGASLGNGGEIDGGLTDFDIDGDNQTWKVFAGLGLWRFLGVEAAWHDFSDVTCCGPNVADAGFDLSVEGISVAALAGLPIGPLRLFAKIGVLSWDVGGVVQTIAGPMSRSVTGEDPMGGVGADFKVFGKLSVRAEWEVFEIDSDSLDVVSVGVQYRF